MVKVLIFLLLSNCFSESKIHAYNKLSEVSDGEYFISKEIKLKNSDENISIPFIEGYEYLIVCKDPNNTTPRIMVGDCEMKNDFIVITPKKDMVKNVTIKGMECSFMLVCFKKKC